LPDYLAYFAYQVSNENTNLPGPIQIQKVGQAFHELLPDSGNWHAFKIELDMVGKECMVQDKLNFSPNSNMCHIGIVWSQDSAREFWIVSYSGAEAGKKASAQQM